MEETATLMCTVTVAGQRDTYSDPLSASRDVPIVQEPGSCSFRYDPGTIPSSGPIQYYRTEVTGQVSGNTVTTSGGALIPAPGVQLVESSYRATGQVFGNSMTLSGSGPFRANQTVQGGLIANISCTFASTAAFTRPTQPPPPPVPAYVQWIRQSGSDAATGVAVDPSGVYLVGRLFTGSGGSDAFVQKYDVNGNELWIRQFGTAGRSNVANGVSVGAFGVYMVGDISRTDSALSDAFVRKYDVDGNEQWTRRFSSAGSDTSGLGGDTVYGVAGDASGVYIVGIVAGVLPGQTSFGSGDAFVRKYDADGSELWTRQFGSIGKDAAYGVAVEPTGIYVVGNVTLGGGAEGRPGELSFGNGDTFVRKYDTNGNNLWTRQFGSTSNNGGYAVTADTSGVYVVGDIDGTLPGQRRAGGWDVFVRKYTTDGNEVWTRQFGTFGEDEAGGVAVDASGVYIVGRVAGVLPGQTAIGAADVFTRKYDLGGNELWTRQFGSTNTDYAWGVAVDTSGIYVAGRSFSALPGQTNLPFGGGFVLKLSVGTTPASVPLTLDTGGSRTTSTGGMTANVRSGYATATVDTGVAPFGTAVFSLSQNGVVVSEAAVPASPPTQRARIFIDYRTGVTAGVGALNINTGFAIANRGSLSATITYALRDRNGQIVATGRGSLNPNAHFAKVIQELRDVAPDFNLPASFPTAIGFGSLDITSSQPVSIVALRLTTNERGETLLTTTPIADLFTPPTSLPLYFPQLADGGGYTTTLILMNTSNASQAGTLALFDDNGAPLTLTVGGMTASSFPYSAPAGGVFIFGTAGSTAVARTGWAKLTPIASNSSPVGAGVFSYSRAGILVTESGVPSAIPTTTARIYVDKSGGHDTGLAIGNPGSSVNSIVLQAFQNNGSTAAGNGQATLNILSNAHSAKFVGQLIEGLPDGFTGVVRISSASPFVALTLRSLSNSRGDFLLTTFPIADVNQPAPAPIVFPQIADGGGYKTQFIFISAAESATVSVNFLGDDGSPLNVGTVSP